VIRRSELIEQLQREFRIIVTGPTTLAAILNSLQMGFKTLAIQKRSSEVWKVLGAIKTEFGKFGSMLEKAQKNLHTATNQLDELVGKRTKAIQRKLKDVETLPLGEAAQYLPEVNDATDETEEEQEP
jgi:DNA recombination protein RmuC